jgi:hypothetical protein
LEREAADAAAASAEAAEKAKKVVAIKKKLTKPRKRVLTPKSQPH